MTKFMRGKKGRTLCPSTIERFMRLGYRCVVWQNGDFMVL